ncbi:abc transporter permease protein yxdm [Anaeramoeba flamelloides]|uniref:Abc transporter permease protein yxdm n=1 Tax=Anaeramoeba flamelloides TaxID=1746091 RepID=A0AAV8AAL6_9EUKA|nr:abc transporter permease protein yxdm [Anaeramoeba flamelloides]|eukprot:Anaeramoba_flamelloidesa568457_49.p1 GENE.a568457_49~~a568457_49.p1  ORF type:complete len:1157 (-),score=216.04 a568457_49:193-3663(-)
MYKSFRNPKINHKYTSIFGGGDPPMDAIELAKLSPNSSNKKIFEMCYRYITRDTKKRPRSFFIGVFTVFLVVFFVSVVQNAVEQAPSIYLALSEDQIGEVDALLMPGFLGNEMKFINYTDTKPKLNNIKSIKGSSPRWIYRSKIESKENSTMGTVANLVILDTKEESEIGLGRSWEPRDLNEQECVVSSSILRELDIEANAGDRIIIKLDLNLVSESFGYNFQELLSNENLIESFLDQFLNIDPNQNYTIFPGVVINGSMLNDFIYENVKNIINPVNTTIPTLDIELIVIDAVEKPRGKWPSYLGNVVMLDSKYIFSSLINSLSIQLGSIVGSLEQLGILDENSIENLSKDYNINEYAIMLNILLKDRTTKYLSSGQDLTDYMLAFSNDIMDQIGIDYPGTLTLPVYQTLLGLQFMRYFLDQIFGVTLLILSYLGCSLIYSLLLTDIEEKTYEYGMLRALGMPHRVLIRLLILQSIFFAVPGIVFGLGLSGIINIPIARLLSGFARFEPRYVLSWSSTLLSGLLGLLMPVISNIIPIRRALSNKLRDSLDLYHDTSSDISVTKIKLNRLKISLNGISMSIFMVAAGLIIYYLVPLTFVYQSFVWFFAIFSGILVLMLLGFAILAQVLQPFFENAILFCLTYFKMRRFHSLIKKNLTSHRKRNKKTALMLTISLAAIIFAGTMFKLQSNSITQSIEFGLGSDFIITSSDPLKPIEREDYIGQLEIEKERGDVIDYTFISFDLDEYNDISSVRLGNLAMYRSTPVKIVAVDENFLKSTYSEYFLHTEYNENLKYQKTNNKIDFIKSLYTDVGNTEIPMDKDFELPIAINSGQVYNNTFFVDTALNTSKSAAIDNFDNKNIYLRTTKEYYEEYLDVLVSEAIRTRTSLDTTLPIKIMIQYRFEEDGETKSQRLIYLAKARAMLKKAPGFFLSSYQVMAYNSPVMVSEDTYMNLLKKIGDVLGSSASAAVNMTKPPAARLLIKKSSKLNSTQAEDLLNRIKAVGNRDDLIFTNTVQTVESAEVAVEGLLIFFNLVSSIASVICFFILWLSFAANIRENSWEFGILRAIGITDKQTMRLYIFEALSLVMASLFLGSLIGIIIATTLNFQFLLFIELPFKFIFPHQVFWPIVAMSFLIAIFGSLLSARDFRKKEIASVLKGK